ncbi:MAG: sugar phosphate isomerase/epimerase family protein [Fimbriimonadaceae bacterium]
MPTYPISIQLYTLRKDAAERGIDPILRDLAEIGYAGIEGSGYGKTPSEFRRAVEDLGMVISSYFGPFPDPDQVGEFIQIARDLGTTNTVSGLWIPDFESVDAIKRSAQRIRAAIAPIRDAGMTFALHNHWMEFEPVEGQLAVDRLIEECPDLLLELDVYWAAAHGINKPEEQLRRHADRTPLIHMKDGPFTQGAPMVAVGSGSQDVAAIFEAANPEVLKWVIVELDECATDMMTAVRESYEFLTQNGYCHGRV